MSPSCRIWSICFCSQTTPFQGYHGVLRPLFGLGVTSASALCPGYTTAMSCALLSSSGGLVLCHSMFKLYTPWAIFVTYRKCHPVTFHTSWVSICTLSLSVTSRSSAIIKVPSNSTTEVPRHFFLSDEKSFWLFSKETRVLLCVSSHVIVTII